jgi:predicted RNA-binding Zn-ribbon protein involved in translation (DUF1610 family)
MNIRVLACELAEAAEAFRAKARRFFYRVMLIGHRCPGCNGFLDMVSESKCRCVSCGKQLDPTVVFQRCPACGGVPVVRVCRYQCKDCGGDIESRFLFHGLVFDADYFRTKMAESRQRKQEQRDRVRQMLAESRSGNLVLEHADLSGVPGLLEALNALTAGLDDSLAVEYRAQFDLRLYESHVQAHLRDYPVSLAGMPPLGENLRKDLIWRFIAVIFLAHAGVIDVWQDGRDIMVRKHEANRERCDISGESEAVGELEGPVDRAEAG